MALFGGVTVKWSYVPLGVQYMYCIHTNNLLYGRSIELKHVKVPKADTRIPHLIFHEYT